MYASTRRSGRNRSRVQAGRPPADDEAARVGGVTGPLAMEDPEHLIEPGQLIVNPRVQPIHGVVERSREAQITCARIRSGRTRGRPYREDALRDRTDAGCRDAVKRNAATRLRIPNLLSGVMAHPR